MSEGSGGSAWSLKTLLQNNDAIDMKQLILQAKMFCFTVPRFKVPQNIKIYVKYRFLCQELEVLTRVGWLFLS